MNLLQQIRPRYASDGTGPSTPGAPTLVGSVTTTGFSITWTPASDISGVLGYRVYLAVDPGTPARISADQVDTVARSWTFSGLTPNTTYRVRVDAVDVFGNASSLSSITNIATTVVGPVSTYRNPYNETFQYLQGNTAGNGVESSTTRQLLKRFDIVVLQWKWPAAHGAEDAYMSNLRTIAPHLKILMYTDPRFVTDGDYGGGGTTTVVRNVIESPGAPARWKAENAANDWLAYRFNFNSCRASNLTDLTGTNAAGNTFRAEWWIRVGGYFQFDLYDGVMIDDANMIGNNLSVYGVNASVNWDYRNIGVDDNYLSNATFKSDFSTAYRALFDEFRSRFPGKLLTINTDPAFWYRQTEAEGCPQRPFSSHPYYQNDDVPFLEGAFEFAAGLSEFGRTDDVYPIRGFFSLTNLFQGFEYYRQIAKPAELNLMGVPVAFAHGNLAIGDTGTPSQLTYAHARARWALGRLAGVGYATSRSGSVPFPLDEICLNLGAPTTTTVMGTLNESAAPATFALRSPNATNGSAQFYWVEHENALIVVRFDITGLTPGVSNFGDGTAVSYTLPSPGAGKKWQRPNCASYAHPTIADLVMQNQSPAINNGADATSSSLKPLHAEVFLRVNGAVNQPPAWSGAPAATGTLGTPLSIPLSSVCSDPESDPISYAQKVGATALPTGWTLSGGNLNYSGGGSVGTTSGCQLTATATGGSADSPVFAVVIQAAAPATDITTLGLTSTVGGTLLPFTVAHGFKQGDVPTGQYLQADITNFQADVQNTWPDGSVKIALLSGRRDLTANVQATVTIRKSAVAPTGTPLTLAQLRAALASGTLVFSSGVSATLDIPTVIAGTPHRTRAAGTQMIEAHWRAAVGADAHLVAWFFVRYYAGGQLEVETVIENGYLRVASPGRKTYTANLTINGSSRFNSAVTHEHHTRWSRWDWYGTNPNIKPAHNLAYLKSTKLVPNVPAMTATSGAWSSNSENWNGLDVPATEANSGTPFALGNFANPISAGGDAASIGILPAWEVLYLSSGDSRAYDATVINARNFGRYPLCYRDESTQKAPRLTQNPELAFGASNAGWNYGWGAGDGSDRTPSPSTSIPSAQVVDAEHQPSAPYLAYLLTGRYQFIEACQFAAASTLISRASIRGGASCLYGLYYDASEDAGRVWAWGLRQAVWAACITPDSDTVMQGEFRTIVDNNVADRLAKVTTGGTANNLGIIAFQDAEGATGGYWTNKPWMLAFFATVLGQAYDLNINGDSTKRTTHANLLTQVYKFVVGIHGNGTGFNYRRAGIYRFSMSSGGTGPAQGATFLADWPAVYAASMATLNVGVTAFGSISSADGQSLSNMVLGSYGGTPYERPIVSAGVLPISFNAQVSVPLAYAVDHGAVGAQAAYDRFVTSSSFVSYSGEYANRPKWRLAPRTASSTTVLQQQAAALGANSWSGNFASASLSTNDGQGTKPLEVIKNGSTKDHYTDWGGKAGWDSVARRMLILGSPNGSGTDPLATALGIYDETTDAWSKVINPIGVAAGHSYDNYDVDSAGRRIFKNSFQQSQGVVFVRNLDSGAVTNLGASGSSSSVGGLAWFPTYGAQGSLIVCANGAIRRYNFASPGWTNIGSVTIGESAFAHYNPVADAVFCGGGDSASGRVYRVANDGTITDLGVPPVRLSSDQASHAIVVPHPTTSAMLAFCANADVRSMTSSGSWSVVGSIPSGLRSPDFPSTLAAWNSVVASIPARGVVMFAQYYEGAGTAKAFIYKPA